jgi:glutamine amidotransferase
LQKANKLIKILNYGVGNPISLRNLYHRIGINSELASSQQDLRGATKLILPGVGSYDAAMTALKISGMHQTLDKLVVELGVPVLGICLGMQMMMNGSSEGVEPGLGWINGKVLRLIGDSTHKVPHVGWSEVKLASTNVFTSGLEENSRFYFSHSYFVEMLDPSNIILTTDYIDTITVGFASKNIFGVQFHPEKSHKYGQALLRNFALNVK